MQQIRCCPIISLTQLLNKFPAVFHSFGKLRIVIYTLTDVAKTHSQSCRDVDRARHAAHTRDASAFLVLGSQAGLKDRAAAPIRPELTRSFFFRVPGSGGALGLLAHRQATESLLYSLVVRVHPVFAQ